MFYLCACVYVFVINAHFLTIRLPDLKVSGMLSRELLLTGVVHLFDPLTVSAVLWHVIVHQARVVDHVAAASA